MDCGCPGTDVELSAAVFAADAEELVVCDAAYALLLTATFGAGATAAARPSFVVYRGNPLGADGPVVPQTTVRPGLQHG